MRPDTWIPLLLQHRIWGDSQELGFLAESPPVHQAAEKPSSESTKQRKCIHTQRALQKHYLLLSPATRRLIFHPLPEWAPLFPLKDHHIFIQLTEPWEARGQVPVKKKKSPCPQFQEKQPEEEGPWKGVERMPRQTQICNRESGVPRNCALTCNTLPSFSGVSQWNPKKKKDEALPRMLSTGGATPLACGQIQPLAVKNKQGTESPCPWVSVDNPQPNGSVHGHCATNPGT